jgi:long-chain fatty acid transport protein
MPLRRFLSRFICIILASFSFPLFCYSEETLSTVPDTAEALSRFGGRFATLQDASALRVAPARLADIEKTQVLLSTAAWRSNIRFDGRNGSSLAVSEPWVFPASLYIAHPIVPKKLAIGIGVSTPYGLSAEYPSDMDVRLRYLVPKLSRLMAVDITPAISMRVSDSLKIGVGLDIIYSELTLRQAFPWALAVPGSPEGSIELQGSGWGLGAYMGIEYEFSKGHRLALIGRLPVKVNYEGDFTADKFPATLSGAGFSRQSEFESDFTFPGSIALGYGADLTDKLTFGLDFKWSANESQDALPLKIGNNQALLASNEARFDWKNSIDLGASLAYQMNEHWALRGSYMFSENSQEAQNYTPIVPSGDRHVFSLGVGWTGENRRVDLTYAYVLNARREINGAAQPAFNGRYRQEWNVLALSFTQFF